MMKKSLFALTVALAIAVLAAGSVQAQDLASRNSPRLMQGLRPNTMGGAFVALKGTDENALFYNPAAINDFPEDIHMQFLLPTAEVSYKAIPFLASDIPDLADAIDGEATNAGKIRQFRNFTTANVGRYEEAGVRGSIANLMHKYVAASLFYDNRSVVALTNPASATVDIEALTQFGLQAGSAYSFFDDLLQVGLALKFVERHLLDETITERDIIANNNFSDILDTDNFGFGFGADLGVKAHLPFNSWKLWESLDPSFGLVLQDIGHTRFSNGLGKQRESLTFGFALHPNFWKLKSAFAFDLRDLDNRTDLVTKMHAGYEVIWPDVSTAIKAISARIGFNQGYYIAGGFGMDFKYFKFNLGTWGRETGRASLQKQSRMFGVQLASGF